MADQPIAWKSCGAQLQCAQVSVPLNWDQPDGAHITLAVIRRLAPIRNLSIFRMESSLYRSSRPRHGGSLTATFDRRPAHRCVADWSSLRAWVTWVRV